VDAQTSPSRRPTTSAPTAEFQFRDEDFEWVRAEIRRRTGITLGDSKRNLVYNRLARRLRALGLSSFEDYVEYLSANPDAELGEFVNALTTNVTAFFRENHHFEMLADEVLPGLLARHARDRRIRIWSAGCSSGQEPYSIAMTLLEAGAKLDGWDVKILATDLDTDILEQAQAAVYAEDRVAGMPDERLRRWFLRGAGANAGQYRLKPEVRGLVTFRQLNLMDPWPMKGPFDVIFCRNVIIYFDKPTQARLVHRFTELLGVGGHLFLGHSESVLERGRQLEVAGRSAYRRNP
jgi:chemotaxis protein methyltransferase CheR